MVGYLQTVPKLAGELALHVQANQLPQQQSAKRGYPILASDIAVLSDYGAEFQVQQTLPSFTPGGSLR